MMNLASANDRAPALPGTYVLRDGSIPLRSGQDGQDRRTRFVTQLTPDYVESLHSALTPAEAGNKFQDCLDDSPTGHGVGHPQTLKCNTRLGLDGGRYRIRTYDFHRVKMALYR
jgi:hypothetical protein